MYPGVDWSSAESAPCFVSGFVSNFTPTPIEARFPCYQAEDRRYAIDFGTAPNSYLNPCAEQVEPTGLSTATASQDEAGSVRPFERVMTTYTDLGLVVSIVTI